MQSFKDAEGRDWIIRIDVPLNREVKAAVGVNLFALIEDELKPWAALVGDPEKFVDVLHTLCREQCEARKLSPVDFARGLLGDALDAAERAFTAALIDFFPNPQVRANLRAMMTKARAAHEAMGKRAARELEKLDPEKAADVAIARLQKRLSGSASSAPASSESISLVGPSAT